MLDKNSLQILNFIDKNGTTDIKFLCDKFPNVNVQDVVDSLKKAEHIKGLTPKQSFPMEFFKSQNITPTLEYFSPYQITPAGKACLESHYYQKKELFFNHLHTWINTVIAVLALLMAIPALILTITQLMPK